MEEVGGNRDVLVPRAPSEPVLERMFEFVGLLLGVALRFKLPLPLSLPPQIWKALVDQPITDDDVFDIDIATEHFVGTQFHVFIHCLSCVPNVPQRSCVCRGRRTRASW